MKIVAIIQARMSSSRLPGKVLLDIAGQPMLAHVVERTRHARTIDQVVVATTTDSSDDPIAAFCQQSSYSFYRGSLYDVLDRYYQAACNFSADVIVRITADCPLIDPDLIDSLVGEFLGLSNIARGPFTVDPATIPYDFAANRLPPPWGRTYPIGLDTEICTFKALELAWHEAQQPYQREHVMPFFYDQPERFRILHVNHAVDYGKLRWTVDTPEDLDLLRRIYAGLADKENFTWLDVLALLEHKPELAKINQQIQPKDYREFDIRNKN